MFTIFNVFKPVALAAAFVFGGALISDANAYSRSTSTTGPAGGKWSSTGAGSCSGGKCASSRTTTGPRGGTATRSGSTSCGGGSCSGQAAYTGPRGNTATRTRSTSY